MKKLKVGIFSLTCCQGCQWEVLDLEEVLIEIMHRVDVVHFPLIKEHNDSGKLDVAFIEGTIVTEEEKQKVLEVRAKSDFVVALGTCACFGGVPTIRSFFSKKEVETEVYDDPRVLNAVYAEGIGDVIDVDYYMRGCPITKEEFVAVIKQLLLGNKPKELEQPVCVECRAKGNKCLLLEGEHCMGPVINGGCDALCPTEGHYCFGCRGPLKHANVDSIVKLYKKYGFGMKDITQYLNLFAGTSKVFSKYEGKIKWQNK